MTSEKIGEPVLRGEANRQRLPAIVNQLPGAGKLRAQFFEARTGRRRDLR